MLDDDFKIVEGSAHAADILGPDYLGKKILDLIEPAKRVQFEQTLKASEVYSKEFEAELKLPNRTAICCWKISRKDKLRAVGRDITDDVHKKHELQGTLDRLNLALATMEMGIWELNDVQKSLIWDDRMYAHYGLKPEDFTDPKDLYKAAYEMAERDKMNMSVEDLDKARQMGMEIQGRYPLRAKDGTIKYMRMLGRPLANKAERTYFGVVWDETEAVLKERQQKQTEAKLMASSKMFALGEMSGGVAHEINNPLTVIQARAFQLQQLAESTPIDPEKIMTAAESISKTADKIARIVRSLRSFAREGDSDIFEVVSVKQMIDEILEFTQSRLANAGILAKVKPFPEYIEFEGRRMQIAQALLSLLNNSFEAIKNFPQRWIEFEVKDGETYFEISVTDSGTGISKDVAAKMFQPFFTTREVGHGMGLGLSTSIGAVKSHNGDLYYDDKSPNTRFVLRLPKFQ